MLKQLYIKNFALIDELDIEFHKGFSVITGETGAGKSIILGALGLLLGNRADTKAIKEGENRCIVEAQFCTEGYDINDFFTENDIDIIDNECLLRREINASGKSRAFINDTPVGLPLMKELGEKLVDIHSQHQNLLLQKDDFQLSVTDIIANNQTLLDSYTTFYSAYHEAEQALEKTKASIEANRQNADFLRYQYEELAKLQLKSGEVEVLDRQSNTMQHSEDIKGALFDADTNLGDEDTGILVRLHRCISSLNGISSVYPQAEEAINRLESTYVELKDLSSDISDRMSEIDYDPDEMERINNRLDAIYALEHKHHVDTVEELIAIEQKLKEQIDNIDNSDAAIGELESAVAQYKKKAQTLATQLSSRRKESAARIEKEMSARLQPLGLPNVRFKVELKSKDLSADGADKAEFLFSANPGAPLRPVGEIASGGEIARVMLSLKSMLSETTNLPTIIFDEIDTGVSGRVAEQMAVIMKGMGNANRQVISITHLPQIAAMGSSHYKVYKEQHTDRTETHMKELNNEERIAEIAQMLSGSSVSEAAVNNAKELLGL